MSTRKFFVLTFVLHILVFQFTAARFDIEDENDDDEFRPLKRFLFNKPTTASNERIPSVINSHVDLLAPKKPSNVYEKSTPASSDACANNPCEHEGICIPKGQMAYECQCVGPWRGIHCGVADACYQSPCQNGGTCLKVHDDYWCKCTNDYYGVNCQKKFSSSSRLENHCRPHICNIGQCVSLKTTYYCECPNDRYGDHCEKRLNKREGSSDGSYYNLMHHLKRDYFKKNAKYPQRIPNNYDVAYYDPKNGIYF